MTATPEMIRAAFAALDERERRAERAAHAAARQANRDRRSKLRSDADLAARRAWLEAELDMIHDRLAGLVDELARARRAANAARRLGQRVRARQATDRWVSLDRQYEALVGRRDWWEDRLEHPETIPLTERGTLDEHVILGYRDRSPQREFDSAPDRPDPTPMRFEDHSPESQRRMIRWMSDARNWAWEPTGETRVIPSLTGNHGNSGAMLRQLRTYPGHHIVGVKGDLAFAREAIITVWSRKLQTWMVVRCYESEPLGRSLFTSWVPEEYVVVPGEHDPRLHAEPKVDRPSLDDHSDRTIENLDTALRWAYDWAAERREALAYPDPDDALASAVSLDQLVTTEAW